MAAQLTMVRPPEFAVELDGGPLTVTADRPQILVVDDENGPRQALRMLLKEEYAVHLAEDVDSAIAILKQKPIELVITDVRMPKRSGVDLLREVKQSQPDLQVIVLTGYGQLETAVKAVEYGAFSYMEKPFDNDAMLDMVRAGLEKYREERDRRALEFLALEANRCETVGRVISGMMHDLGSPLTVLSSQIDLLSMDPSRSDTTGRLEVMRQQVDHCSDLVRSTMDFMRSEPEVFRRHSINDVVSSCLEVARPQLREHKVKIVSDFGTDLPAVSGHLVSMRQAILNLITNACHALDSKPSDRVITINTQRVDGAVVVSVADNGPGIPESIGNKVFDTFFTTKGKAGTGLGLSVVRNVMRKHSGFASLESPAEGGARFVLRFPVGN